MNKKSDSERDICNKLITPPIDRVGWDIPNQLRQKVTFAKGCVAVRGKPVPRGKPKRADYILDRRPKFSIAAIEAKRLIESAVHQLLNQSVVHPIEARFDRVNHQGFAGLRQKLMAEQ